MHRLFIEKNHLLLYLWHAPIQIQVSVVAGIVVMLAAAATRIVFRFRKGFLDI